MNDFNKYMISAGITSTQLLDYAKYTNSLTPVIIDERKDNMIQIDVFSRMMSDRIIFLGTGVYDTVANIMNAQLLYLNHQDPNKDIKIYINSPGGSVYDGLGIYDTMKFISNKIHTVNTGLCASMAAVLLAGGDKGFRSALPHARTMIHQPLCSSSGQASDINIINTEIQKLKKELYKCLSNDTGKDIKTIEIDADRDYYMTSKEAKKYGMIDKVLGRQK